jgi:hypothetical protein
MHTTKGRETNVASKNCPHPAFVQHGPVLGSSGPIASGHFVNVRVSTKVKVYTNVSIHSRVHSVYKSLEISGVSLTNYNTIYS